MRDSSVYAISPELIDIAMKFVPISIVIVLLVAVIIILLTKKDLFTKVRGLKYKDLEIDFNNYEEIKEHGESQQLENMRMLLLKQLLFTQEFVNRFQPLISKFAAVCLKWDENSELNKGELRYPSLKHSKESLIRFRYLIRESSFNKVINWECPIYDEVNSEFRREYISNMRHFNKELESNSNKNFYIPEALIDVKGELPPIEINDNNVLLGYKEVKASVEEQLKNIWDRFLKLVKEKNLDNNSELDTEEINKFDIYYKEVEVLSERIRDSIYKLEEYVEKQANNEKIFSNKYNYAMDIGYCMYENLLYWNEKTPNILISETSSILYIIFQNLSLWLIRNDLPLSQVNLEHYLDVHADNLIAKINGEIIKQHQSFEPAMWKQALEMDGESDLDINKFFRKNLKEWIVGVQQVRFNVNIFMGTEEYKA